MSDRLLLTACCLLAATHSYVVRRNPQIHNLADVQQVSVRHDMYARRGAGPSSQRAGKSPTIMGKGLKPEMGDNRAKR
jgi:hypothetical protein